jgi:hypothetical protein
MGQLPVAERQFGLSAARSPTCRRLRADLTGKTLSQMQGTVGQASPTGSELVPPQASRRQLLWLMAEFFKTIGCTEIRARLPGFMAPDLFVGTLEDHRPDCTCRQPDSGRTPLILDVVTPELAADSSVAHRWSLFSSAAKLYQAELHFVVPRWQPAGAVHRDLRRKLASLEIVPNYIWAV